MEVQRQRDTGEPGISAVVDGDEISTVNEDQRVLNLMRDERAMQAGISTDCLDQISISNDGSLNTWCTLQIASLVTYMWVVNH